MCFVLYAGPDKPLPRKEWRMDAAGLPVASLAERQNPVRAHFSKPEIQCIGSTSGCGCDFAPAMLRNGDWPGFDDDQPDAGQKASGHYNREAPAARLKASGEQTLQLCGVWDSDFDFAAPPRASSYGLPGTATEIHYIPPILFRIGGIAPPSA